MREPFLVVSPKTLAKRVAQKKTFVFAHLCPRLRRGKKICFVHILRCTLPNDKLNVRNLFAQRNHLFRGAKFLGKRRLSCILYTINCEGAADGQTAQDDAFLYYPRSTAKELLAARAEEAPGVLDRIEMPPGVLVTAQEADYKSDLPETTPAGE